MERTKTFLAAVYGHFEAVYGHFYVTLMNVYVHLRREIAGVYRHVDIMVRLQGCLLSFHMILGQLLRFRYSQGQTSSSAYPSRCSRTALVQARFLPSGFFDFHDGEGIL